jgi:hypothetical protein
MQWLELEPLWLVSMCCTVCLGDSPKVLVTSKLGSGALGGSWYGIGSDFFPSQCMLTSWVSHFLLSGLLSPR